MAQVATTYSYTGAVTQPSIGTTATGQTAAAASAYPAQSSATSASATAAQHTAYQQMLEAYQRQQQTAGAAAGSGANAAGGIMYAARPVQYDQSALYQQQQGSLAYQASYQPTAASTAPQQNPAATAAMVATYQQQLAAAYQQQQQQQAAYQQQQLQQQTAYQQQLQTSAYPQQHVAYPQAYQQPGPSQTTPSYPPQYGAQQSAVPPSSYYAVPQQQAPPMASGPLSSVPPNAPPSGPYQDPYATGSGGYSQQSHYDSGMAPRNQYDGPMISSSRPPPIHNDAPQHYGSQMQHRPSMQPYGRAPRQGGGSMGYGPRPQRGGYGSRGPANQTPFLSFYEGDDNDTVPNIIFISELPQTISNELLAQEFSSCGPIATLDEKGERPKVWIYKDRATRVPRGDATITFQDEESAKKAVEKYDGKELFGKTIKVSLVTVKQMNHQIQIRLQIAQNPRNNYGGGLYDQQGGSSHGSGSYMNMSRNQMNPPLDSSRNQGGFYRNSVPLNGQPITPPYRGQTPNSARGRGGYSRGYGRDSATGPSRYASHAGGPRRSRGRPGPY